jgi:PAS domain S-box-containing protein
MNPGDIVAPWAGSSAPAYFKDPNGYLLAANPAFRRKFAWAGTDDPRGSCSRLVHPEDLPVYVEMGDALAKPPHRTQRSQRWQTPQGWRWLSWEESLQFGPGGEAIGILAVGQDITRQKIAEEMWLKLSRAVEQCPVGIAITDPAGRAQYVNPRFAAAIGRSLEEVVTGNTPVLQEGHPDAASFEQVLDLVRAGHDWRGDLSRVNAEGATVWESVQISSIRGHHGEITNLLCLREDITLRKRVEEEQRRSSQAGAGGRAAADRPAPRTGETILVVDDEAILREILQAALTSLGYQVLAAASAAEAIAVVKDGGQSIHAAFLDLNMPGGSGTGVLKVIRADRPFLPVIILSGHEEDEVRALIGGDPLTDSLSKPFRMSQVIEVLRKLLERSKTARLV